MKTLNKIIAGALIVLSSSGCASFGRTEKCEIYAEELLDSARGDPNMVNQGMFIQGIPKKYTQCIGEIFKKRFGSRYDFIKEGDGYRLIEYF